MRNKVLVKSCRARAWLVIAGLVTWAGTGHAAAPSVLKCSDVSLARPNYGTRYTGHVSNSDYRLDVTIPDNLMGWGAAPTAPFHGFTIFTDASLAACIDFRIGIRVDLPEDEFPVHHGKKLKVGNRVGTRESIHGSVGGESFENIRVYLQLRRGDRIDDAVVTLVTPIQTKDQATKIFGRFLGSFRFW